MGALRSTWRSPSRTTSRARPTSSSCGTTGPLRRGFRWANALGQTNRVWIMDVDGDAYLDRSRDLQGANPEIASGDPGDDRLDPIRVDDGDGRRPIPAAAKAVPNQERTESRSTAVLPLVPVDSTSPNTAAQMRADLVERARSGDREAFAQVAAAEVDRLLAIARLILRDSDLAEDAVQETLITCWRQLPNLRDVDRFEGWLYRILVHASADEAKRHRRLVRSIQVIDTEPVIDAAIQVVADRDQLERGFRRLSIDHRAIVVLRHYLGMPLGDVAIALGIPSGTAKSRYHHAMSALRAALEAEARPTAEREVLA